MLKAPLHQALLFGMSIYILSLSVCICLAARKASEDKVTSQNIISKLTLADDANEKGDDAKSKNKFGSRVVTEEDDDDSANNFYVNSIVSVGFRNSILIEPTTDYLSSPRNILTPPPWC